LLPLVVEELARRGVPPEPVKLSFEEKGIHD